MRMMNQRKMSFWTSDCLIEITKSVSMMEKSGYTFIKKQCRIRHKTGKPGNGQEKKQCRKAHKNIAICQQSGYKKEQKQSLVSGSYSIFCRNLGQGFFFFTVRRKDFRSESYRKRLRLISRTKASPFESEIHPSHKTKALYSRVFRPAGGFPCPDTGKSIVSTPT